MIVIVDQLLGITVVETGEVATRLPLGPMTEERRRRDSKELPSELPGPVPVVGGVTLLEDQHGDAVFISDRLPASYPALVDGLGRILADHGIPLRTITGTRDLWCRDFMPVQTAPGEFVQFRYEPDYLREEFEYLITRPGDLEPIPGIEPFATTDIFLDGGNVVGWGSSCVMTAKVFAENPGLDKDVLLERLRGLLRVEQLVVIPREPYDRIGHADGVLRFGDARTMVINDYSEVAPAYRDRILGRL